jgi:hypothetical protein
MGAVTGAVGPRRQTTATALRDVVEALDLEAVEALRRTTLGGK